MNSGRLKKQKRWPEKEGKQKLCTSNAKKTEYEYAEVFLPRDHFIHWVTHRRLDSVLTVFI